MACPPTAEVLPGHFCRFGRSGPRRGKAHNLIMPKVRRKRRRPRAKPYKKRRSVKRRNIIKLTNRVVPKVARVKLVYCDYITMAEPVTTGFTHYKFHANDMYDPDATSVGHQPMGFDQYTAQYQHWMVLRSKITLTRCSTGTAGGVGVLGIEKSDNVSPTFISGEQIRQAELRTNKRSIIIRGEQPARGKVSMSFSSRKFFGSGAKPGEDSYKGTGSAGPAEKAFYHVYWHYPTHLAPGPITFLARIEYTAIFMTPKMIDIS